MNPDEYQRMAAVQRDHWWFAAKRRLVAEVVRQRRGTEAGLSGTSARRATVPPRWVLEVGCGTGSMLPVMREWGQAIGLDAYIPALRHVADTQVVGGDLRSLPFRPWQFRIVGCFDVLYHRRVADVDAALREIHRVCHPQGMLVITDSAFGFLRSSHDAALHGARRFRLPEMCRMLEAAGFRVVYRSYFHAFIFPVAAAVRLAKRIRSSRHLPDRESAAVGPSDLKPAPGWLNRLLAGIYAIESVALTYGRLPFGISIIVLARPAERSRVP